MSTVHRLETGYEPEPPAPDESSSEMDEIRAEAEEIVYKYDAVMHMVVDIYRLVRRMAGDPVR